MNFKGRKACDPSRLTYSFKKDLSVWYNQINANKKGYFQFQKCMKLQRRLQHVYLYLDKESMGDYLHDHLHSVFTTIHNTLHSSEMIYLWPHFKEPLTGQIWKQVYIFNIPTDICSRWLIVSKVSHWTKQ